MPKDPIHYYLIMPLIFLSLQIIIILTYHKLKLFIKNRIPKKEVFTIPTSHEHNKRAKEEHHARIVDNHRKLSLQGEADEK